MSTVKELRDRARELGMTGFSKLRKDGLVKAIKENEKIEAKETACAHALVDDLCKHSLFEQSRQLRNRAKARRRDLREKGFQAGPG